jgi:hypothetical protein
MRLNIGHEDAIVSVVTSSGEEIRPMTQAEVDSHNSEYDLYEKWVAEEKYKDDRKADYPNIGDQLDDLYHAGVFSDEMAAKLKAVKEKHPKE